MISLVSSFSSHYKPLLTTFFCILLSSTPVLFIMENVNIVAELKIKVSAEDPNKVVNTVDLLENGGAVALGSPPETGNPISSLGGQDDAGEF